MIFYVASLTRHAARWRRLRTEGVRVVSTWIDEAGEGQTADYSELATRCIDEVRGCDAILLYVEENDLLKGALIECGVGLALGKPVICIGSSPSISRVFKEHPLWFECADVASALSFAMELEEACRAG